MTLRLVTDMDEWQGFSGRSPHGSVFSAPWFLQALDAEKRLHALDDAAAIVLLRDDRPAPQPYPFTMYQGVLFSAELAGEKTHRRLRRTVDVLDALCRGLAETYDEVSFCLHHAHDDLRGLLWFNHDRPEAGTFATRLRYTGLLDLADDHDGWLGTIRENRRQDLRRAARSGIAVDGSDDVELLLHLYEQTFARQGLTVDGRTGALVRSIAAQALASGNGFLLAAAGPGGATMGMILVLHDDTTGYYLIGANDPAARDSGAGTLLMTEAIRRCRVMGLRRFDFVGINSPARGDFKTSFGAVPRLYVEASWRRPR